MGGSRLRAFLLILLVVQTSATVLLLRYSRSSILNLKSHSFLNANFSIQVNQWGPVVYLDNHGFLH